MTQPKKMRALVVEDEVLIRQATCRALAQEGFLCEMAVDGKQALEKLQTSAFDVVITDLRMPEMHGHMLVVEMLAMENRPAIMVLTGAAEPKLMRDLLTRGVEDVASKPANYEILVLKAKVLAQRRETLHEELSKAALLRKQAEDAAASQFTAEFLPPLERENDLFLDLPNACRAQSSTDPPSDDAQLSEVIQAWPQLAANIRQAIEHLCRPANGDDPKQGIGLEFEEGCSPLDELLEYPVLLN